MKVKFIDVLTSADTITVYKNGNKVDINKEEFNRQFRFMVEHAYYMPGMGIAKDSIIQKELKKGYWVEFGYLSKKTFAEYDFTSLILRLQPDLDGFNVVRGVNGKYEGKTFYLKLATMSTDFYDYIDEQC